MPGKPSAYRIDLARFPLVMISPNPEVGDEDSLDETYRQLEEVLARKQAIGLLFDMRGSASSPKRRRRFVAWMQAHDDEIRRLVPAVAIIVGSELERGIVTAVSWLRTPTTPTRVFTNAQDATAWLYASLGPA